MYFATTDESRMSSSFSPFTCSGSPVESPISAYIFPMRSTIGSKSSDVPITRCVVDLKAELEKLREQVLNVE